MYQRGDRVRPRAGHPSAMIVEDVIPSPDGDQYLCWWADGWDVRAGCYTAAELTGVTREVAAA